MRYFRLIEKIPGRSSLGFGTGAGRWNPTGVPIIYACNLSSLNFLELLSIKGSCVASSSWLLVELEISSEILFLDKAALPADWDRRPYPPSSQSIGGKWARRLDGLALQVPSCRIPLSQYPDHHNLLINPLHRDFPGSVRVVGEEAVSFMLNQ